MNLRRLETFYWASKLGSFAAAAERLNITQSTVSMRIQELEREFGVILFDRTQRAARPTDLGRDLIEHVEQVLRSADRMRSRIAVPESATGTLRIGVAEVISITWLPQLIARIRATYPKVRIELEEALTWKLAAKLEHGMLDVILAAGEIPGYALNSVPLGSVRFAWMTSPALGLPSRRMTPRDLQDWPIIGLSEASFHHASVEDWFQLGNARFTRIGTCNSMAVAASLAISGVGVTLLAVRCFERELGSGQLVEIDAAPAFPPIPFTATCSRASLTSLARQAAELARGVSDFEQRAIS